MCPGAPQADSAEAGRYGAGGFNVANFEWLDAVQPAVSPALYVGVCTLTGFLCVGLALAPRPPRWLIAIALVLHTWSWAMSMLDSYQHHYLLSIVLLALVFFPHATAEEALLPPGSVTTGDPPARPARACTMRRSKLDSRKVPVLSPWPEKSNANVATPIGAMASAR